MDISRLRTSIALFALPIAAACGCAAKPSPPSPTVARGTIEAAATVNPDARGRPSPVAVKLFELKGMGNLERADFFSLFDRERDALGADLLGKEEFTLRPGDRVPVDRPLDAETRYLGVVAGYRGLDRSRWRATVSITPQRVNLLFIRLDGDGLSVRRE